MGESFTDNNATSNPGLPTWKFEKCSRMETTMAGITVSIVAGADAAHSSVNATGSVQHVITDKEVTTFGIQDSPLKNAVGKYFGKNPNDAYLHSPTPWNDLYKTYGWP